MKCRSKSREDLEYEHSIKSPRPEPEDLSPLKKHRRSRKEENRAGRRLGKRGPEHMTVTGWAGSVVFIPYTWGALEDLNKK